MKHMVFPDEDLVVKDRLRLALPAAMAWTFNRLTMFHWDFMPPPEFVWHPSANITMRGLVVDAFLNCRRVCRQWRAQMLHASRDMFWKLYTSYGERELVMKPRVWRVMRYTGTATYIDDYTRPRYEKEEIYFAYMRYTEGYLLDHPEIIMRYQVDEWRRSFAPWPMPKHEERWFIRQFIMERGDRKRWMLGLRKRYCTLLQDWLRKYRPKHWEEVAKNLVSIPCAGKDAEGRQNWREVTGTDVDVHRHGFFYDDY